MPWRSIVLEIDGAAAEPLAEALLARGAASASVEDAAAGAAAGQPVFDEPGAAAGQPVFGEPGAAQASWTRVRLSALVPADADAGALVRNAAADVKLPEPPGFALEPVADRDWVRHVQSQFAPIRISARLWIVPSWRAAPDPDAVCLVLDPGRAFGTGSHPTTRACLQWLERQVSPGARVLDYGCGSGILAIAAVKLGAAEAVGVDIDPDALAAARENAALNRAPARFVDGRAPLEFAADLVVANILAGPLRVLAPLLAGRCRPGGRILLAGILAAQRERVAEAYARWFDVAAFGSDEGWIALEGKRR